jgi:hypothetical protein
MSSNQRREVTFGCVKSGVVLSACLHPVWESLGKAQYRGKSERGAYHREGAR